VVEVGGRKRVLECKVRTGPRTERSNYTRVKNGGFQCGERDSKISYARKNMSQPRRRNAPIWPKKTILQVAEGPIVVPRRRGKHERASREKWGEKEGTHQHKSRCLENYTGHLCSEKSSRISTEREKSSRVPETNREELTHTSRREKFPSSQGGKVETMVSN